MFLTIFVTLFPLLTSQASCQPYCGGFPIDGCVDTVSHECHMKWIQRSTSVVQGYKNIPIYLWSPNSQTIIPIYYFSSIQFCKLCTFFASEVTVFLLYTNHITTKSTPSRSFFLKNCVLFSILPIVVTFITMRLLVILLWY